MQRPLTKNILKGTSCRLLKNYIDYGGYSSLYKILGKVEPTEVTKLIKESGLQGRGGAGFSAGLKMSAVPMGENASKTKYLVANADEMEPGTFKDRLLMEGDPHQLLEGMIISSYAIEASSAFIFLRGEYKLCEKILHAAIFEAYKNGFLGNNILGSGFSLEMHLHMSAGRYICGEETALINALEGRRAIPRSKPPFPQSSGLFGKPTLVQNVETLSNLPHIINNGPDWYKSLGKAIDPGTKIYGVSGKVKNPGAWELPMGTTIRELLFEHAQGMREGLNFRALLPGGASTDFLSYEHLDLPMDYSSMAKAQTRMGTGTMIILDDQTCPVGMLLYLEKFFKQESCGFCTPCRDGLSWVYDLLLSIENGKGKKADLPLLAMHANLLAPGSTFCALAPGAASPLKTGLDFFKDDFMEHIESGTCKYRPTKG